MSTNRVWTEKIAADWQSRDYYEMAESPEWLAIFWGAGSIFKQRFDTLKLDSVLEIACGHGRHAAQFIDRAGHVTLLDVNRSNIDFCKERFGRLTNVDLIVNDGSSFSEIEGSAFTSIFSYDAMVHFEFDDVINYIRECYRVLTPAGAVLLHLSDYSSNPGGLYNENPSWRNFMSLEIAIHVARRTGFLVVASDRFTWGDPANGNVARDCLILLEKT